LRGQWSAARRCTRHDSALDFLPFDYLRGRAIVFAAEAAERAPGYERRLACGIDLSGIRCVSQAGHRVWSVPHLKSRIPSDTTVLYSCHSLVLQNAHDDATVLRLSRFVFADLMALAHRGRSKHSSERKVALLKQDICYIVGAVLA
jgi:hypothetical protein